MHTHTPQGEKFSKKSHPGGAAAGSGCKIFSGHTQCVHTPLVQKPVPTYDGNLHSVQSLNNDLHLIRSQSFEEQFWPHFTT